MTLSALQDTASPVCYTAACNFLHELDALDLLNDQIRVFGSTDGGVRMEWRNYGLLIELDSDDGVKLECFVLPIYDWGIPVTDVDRQLASGIDALRHYVGMDERRALTLKSEERQTFKKIILVHHFPRVKTRSRVFRRMD